jgi:prepilin-type N-terminal cleavage/methylation domain-containing protein
MKPFEPRARRRRGMTLIEIMVGSAVLAVIAVVLLSTVIPLTRFSADTTVALDMEQRARAFFGQLRPELRQSGFAAGVAPIGPNGAMYLLADTAIDADVLPDKLSFRRRTGPADNAWSNTIVIRLDNSPGRLSIVREELDPATGNAVRPMVVLQTGDIDGLEFKEFDGSLEVTLRLARANPNRGLGNEATILRRVYVDRIQLMNRSS